MEAQRSREISRPHLMNSRAKTHAISLWFPKACAPSKSSCCFQPSKLGQCVFHFPPFPCSSAGRWKSTQWVGQWLDTELQGKQEARTKHPARQAACLLTLASAILPTSPEWAVPHLRQSMQWHFQVGLRCHLDGQQENHGLGSHRHMGQRRWGIIHLSLTQNPCCQSLLCPLTPVSCSWTGISCSSMKKKKGHHSPSLILWHFIMHLKGKTTGRFTHLYIQLNNPLFNK